MSSRWCVANIFFPDRYHVGTPPKEVQKIVAEAPGGTRWIEGQMLIFRAETVNKRYQIGIVTDADKMLMFCPLI